MHILFSVYFLNWDSFSVRITIQYAKMANLFHMGIEYQ